MLELIILIGLIIIAVVVVNTVMKVVSIFIMIATWMLAGYLARKIIGGKGKSNPIIDAALGVTGGIIGSTSGRQARHSSSYASGSASSTRCPTHQVTRRSPEPSQP